MLHFALIGNPNCGKTTLFNSLTGSNAHVGNWPGVTVSKSEGTYKKLKEPISIVDLPGIYSLSPYTPEEVVSRNYIIDEKPDCVINIVDATNLERNLYLTTQVLEIDVPMVIALNMMDQVQKNGDKIDIKELEKQIGVPVIEISALKQENLDVLMNRAYEVSKQPRKAITVLDNGPLKHVIDDCRIALEGAKVDNPLFHAIKLVELDELETKMHSDMVEMVNQFKLTNTNPNLNTDFEAVVADSRYKYICRYYVKALTKKNPISEDVVTKSDKVDKVMTHKVWGIPIFILIMFVVFHLTFSSDFLYLGAMGVFKSDWISLQGTFFEGLFGTGGLNSPGVFLARFVEICTSGLNTWIAGLLGNSAEWVQGFICDGVLGGVFSILSFLPQILVLFLFFSILEDSGYMSRIAFILDRIFRKFGLSGRSFVPMIMGFGCSVPAMCNTKTLNDEHERTITIRVIPFFPCGAKLPVLTAVAGAIVSYLGFGNADLITYSMYLISIVTAVVTIILMKSTTQKGDIAPFIMELPAYHLPQFKSLMIHLWDKAKHFIQKAFTVILASTIVIWFISHFSFDWRYLPDTQIDVSILGNLGKFIMPIFTPLGFGSQLNSLGWVFVVAALTGLIAKENIIATLGTLAACIITNFSSSASGSEAVKALIEATGITIPALLAFIVFNLTTVPCVAACTTAKSELPKGKFMWTVLFWIVTSFVVSSATYLIGTWWWTCFIFIAIAALASVGIYLFDHMKKKKVA